MKSIQRRLLPFILAGLSSCTYQPSSPPPSAAKTGYLKMQISQSELANPSEYKRYTYHCKNLETGHNVALVSYFPLSRESRLKENFGFYFQLNNGKAQPFDHIENRSLNARGSRFEVIYRSYQPIDHFEIELIARQRSSIYYKIQNGTRKPWLNCKER